MTTGARSIWAPEADVMLRLYDIPAYWGFFSRRRGTWKLASGKIHHGNSAAGVIG